MAGTTASPDLAVSCPECGGREGLVWLGKDMGVPNHWLQWATTATHYYVCAACCAIASLVEIEGRTALPEGRNSHGAAAPRPAHAARHDYALNTSDPSGHLMSGTGAWPI